MSDFLTENSHHGLILKKCNKNEKIVIIPESIKAIDRCAFEGCDRIEKIVLPEGLIHIPETFVEFLPRLKKICVSEKNRIYASVNGVLYNKYCTSLIACPMDRTLISVPEGVELIQDSAFSHHPWLTDVILPNSLITISDSAFFGCENLARIYIPPSVKVIGRNAFYGTPWLKQQKLKNPFLIINGILVDRNIYQTHVTVPNTVTCIGENAFWGLSKMRSIIIPESVKEIQNYAFGNCSNLREIFLPDGVKCIGYDLFYKYYQDITIHYKGLSFPFRHAFNIELRKFLWMINFQNFDEELDDYNKYHVIWAMFDKNPEDETLLHYIGRHFNSMFCQLIDEQQTQIVEKILKTGKFITQNNIDEFISYAIKNQKPEIQLILINHKYQHFDFHDDDIRRRFAL